MRNRIQQQTMTFNDQSSMQVKSVGASAAKKVAAAPVSADAEAAPLTPLKDAYDFNLTFNWVDTSKKALPTHIQDLVSAWQADPEATMRGKPVLPQGDNAPGTVRWQLDAGVMQDVSDGVITYTFATWNHGVGQFNSPKFGQGKGYSPFTAEQIEAGRIAVQNWDDLISAKFVEIPAGPGASVYGQNNADIVLSNTTTGPAQAEAYYPGLVEFFGKKYQRIEGDVWVADPAVNGSNLQFLPGQYGLQTLNHELGHTLGLNHPGSYNFGDDQDGDGVPDPINYTGDAQYFQDSHQFTIMSYFDAYETGGASIDWNVMRFIYPSTPMVDDVFVIQQKYGADMTTRAGNSTYGFNASGDVTNEALAFHKGDLISSFTIWDGGGNDTLDLSGYYTDSVIDLREGGYSSAGGWGAYDPAVEALDLGTMDPAAALAIIDANNAAIGMGPRTLPASDPRGTDYIYRLYIDGQVPSLDAKGNPILDANGNPVYLNEGLAWKDITGAGPDFLMENNIGIAYGAIIENAVGGHGDDRINGNQANNTFTGGAGDDTFIIADYSGKIADATDKTDWSKTVVDTSTDTITDFGNGNDVLDLSSFKAKGVTGLSDVSWDDASDTLILDSNNNGQFDANDVHVIIHGTFTTGDIFFG